MTVKLQEEKNDLSSLLPDLHKSFMSVLYKVTMKSYLLT